MVLGHGLNLAARECFATAQNRAAALRIAAPPSPCGAQVLDFGVHVAGGLQAGLQLAQICMAGQAQLQLGSGPSQVWHGPWIQVTTDRPLEACMLSQYAGWPVKHEKFFAMGSGAMRLRRGREELLQSLQAGDGDAWAVGTLECDALPGEAVLQHMAEQCAVPADQLLVAVAPTRSLAGVIQVVARSAETCLHKLHELGFDLRSIRAAYGLAPVPPPTPDFALGIGRTNDAILFAGQVSLWVDCDDEQIAACGPRIPSSASADFGRPFAEIFKACGYDFYGIDPGLFSPAQITMVNLRSGRSWRFGDVRPDLLARSFAGEVS